MKFTNIRLTLILTLLSVSLLFGSCKKFLQQDPISEFGPDYVFGSTSDAEKAVFGAYQCLSGDYGFGDRLSTMMPYSDDIMTSSSASTDVSRGFLAQYNFSAPYSEQLLYNPWNLFFTGIERANICIKNIPEMSLYANGTELQKATLRRFHGEVLTLRALYYHELIKMWGDVPAHFVPSAFSTDLYTPRTDKYIIYDQILADLEQAATLLPWRNEASGTIDADRISKGAAKAIRARIALFAGGFSLGLDGTIKRPTNYLAYYNIAKAETADLISTTNRSHHTLNPSYQSVFKDGICAHKFDAFGETMFEIGMGGNTTSTDSKLGYDNGPRISAGNNAGNGYPRILPTYFYMFEPTDKRRDVTIAPYNITQTTGVKLPGSFSSSSPGIYDGKFRRDWITNPIAPIDGTSGQYFGLNWPVIRFSDVLLMYAEAENEINGATTSALAAINEVRARAGVGNITSTANFSEAIMKERALELGAEGIRKFDLIRWNKIYDKITETKQTMDAIAAALQSSSPLPSPYTNYPRVIYAKYNSTTGLLEYGNSFYAPYTSSDPVPVGYTTANRYNWLSVLYSSTAVTTANPHGLPALLAQYASGTNGASNLVGFVKNKHELLPIPNSVRSVNTKIVQNPNY